MTQTQLHLQDLIAEAASEKKARDIIILDMKEISMVVDHYVICSANSTTQVKAIADNIEEKLAEQGIKVLHTEGYNTARWILLDFGSVAVHVFVEEDRQFYNLERLWGDAQSISYES